MLIGTAALVVVASEGVQTAPGAAVAPVLGALALEDEAVIVVGQGVVLDRALGVVVDAGLDLVLKSKNTYDEASQTQFSPGIYELYQGATLLQREEMDFQTHLYRFGEMEQCLAELGFPSIKTYSTFSKDIAVDNRAEMFLFECSI